MSAKEVETVINQQDDVTESSVVGIPDAKWGETVAAAVVVKDGSDLSDAAIVARPLQEESARMEMSQENCVCEAHSEKYDGQDAEGGSKIHY